MMKLEHKIEILMESYYRELSEMTTALGELPDPKVIKDIYKVLNDISKSIGFIYHEEKDDEINKAYEKLINLKWKEIVLQLQEFFKGVNVGWSVSYLSVKQRGIFKNIARSMYWSISEPLASSAKEKLQMMVNFYSMLGGSKPWIRGYVTIYNAMGAENFKHGEWNVTIRQQATKEQIEQTLKQLDKAAELCIKKGFKEIVGGEVIIAAGGTTFAGEYSPTKDTIKLSLTDKYRESAVFTLVHELGHRWWYKFADSSKIIQYTKMAAESSGQMKFDYNDRGLWWFAFFDKETGLLKRGNPKKELRKFFKWTFKEHHEAALAWIEKIKGEMVKVLEKYGLEVGNNQQWKKRLISLDRKTQDKYYKDMYKIWIGDPNEVFEFTVKGATVSDYSRKNMGEDFADTFATYVVKGKIGDPQIAERFKMLTGKG